MSAARLWLLVNSLFAIIAGRMGESDEIVFLLSSMYCG